MGPQTVLWVCCFSLLFENFMDVCKPPHEVIPFSSPLSLSFFVTALESRRVLLLRIGWSAKPRWWSAIKGKAGTQENMELANRMC